MVALGRWSLSTVAIVWDNVPCQADTVAKDRWSLREGGRWYRFHCAHKPNTSDLQDLGKPGKPEDSTKVVNELFHPKRFPVHKRFEFWSVMDRKTGETIIQELTARIRQAVVTCNFTSITDPLDEVMRTRFLCSISNEAVLKALFKVEDELMFAQAIQIATKPEEAAKVAKETV